MLTKNKTIFINALKSHGFLDLSSDKNGMAYRKDLPGRVYELCYYIIVTGYFLRNQEAFY